METSDIKAAVAEKLLSLDVTYHATFIPFSRSRSAKKDAKVNEMSLNWVVTLHRHGARLTTDYRMGVGHAPSYKQHMNVDDAEAVRRECENGRLPFSTVKDLPISPPHVADVLYSLLMDAEALDHASFEEWADSLGYDVDSRKAEATYRACLDTGLKLRALLGDATIKEFRELMQDY